MRPQAIRDLPGAGGHLPDRGPVQFARFHVENRLAEPFDQTAQLTVIDAVGTAVARNMPVDPGKKVEFLAAVVQSEGIAQLPYASGNSDEGVGGEASAENRSEALVDSVEDREQFILVGGEKRQWFGRNFTGSVCGQRAQNFIPEIRLFKTAGIAGPYRKTLNFVENERFR